MSEFYSAQHFMLVEQGVTLAGEVASANLALDKLLAAVAAADRRLGPASELDWEALDAAIAAAKVARPGRYEQLVAELEASAEARLDANVYAVIEAMSCGQLRQVLDYAGHGHGPVGTAGLRALVTRLYEAGDICGVDILFEYDF